MSASQLLELLGAANAMYAVVESSDSDSIFSRVFSLGASVDPVPVASVGTCVGTRPGATLMDASLSFTLDSRASKCFLRDHTTLTPLPAPVSIALADPTLGPVIAHHSTTLPCPAVPSGSLMGFHVPSFSRNLQQQPPQQEQQEQLRPPTPPVSGLRALGLPSPSPPSSPSPLVYNPTFPPLDPTPAVFPCSQPPLSAPLSHTWASRSPRARPLSPVPVTELRTVLFRSSSPCSSPFVLPSPPDSALNASLSTPIINYYRTYRPDLSRVLASLVTGPRASLSFVSALTAAVTEFSTNRRLDYASRVVAAPPTRPLAVGGSWASQWRAAMDAEMASYGSTGTYVDEVPPPPPGANVVDGMWIFKMKRPPGSPPFFKARYVARDFSQSERVDFFQSFAPTPKTTTLRVLLHVAAQRYYELHSLNFSTAFLQGTLHEEVWLRRPSAFSGTFPPGTQWRLRRLVYGLRQAPCEWHDTLRSTVTDLGFQPSSTDLSLFVHRGSTHFFVLVYVDNLVFATADMVSLADVKSELQRRHTFSDLGELRHYLGLQITRDRAARTITLTQSHMVQQVLQRLRFQFSTTLPTPLAVDHILTGSFPDEPFEPSGPYPELVGCLMYLMTCTRLDLAFLLSILARFVAPGRHRPCEDLGSSSETRM
ncbi:unnamed protein product [Closterium sp. NIES-54]